MTELETTELRLNSFEVGCLIGAVENNIVKYPENQQPLQPLLDKLFAAAARLVDEYKK